MKLLEPTHILFESHGERHRVKQIVLYGREYRFYKEGNDIILKDFSG